MSMFKDWETENNSHLAEFKPYVMILKNSFETIIIKNVIFHVCVYESQKQIYSVSIFRPNGEEASYSGEEVWNIQIQKGEEK